jgi:RNA polymerase sigma-70 factor (ECF subfamily)
MRDLCELEYADIAELLDVPVGTIKSRIHDGRAKLRHALYGSESGETGRTSHRRQQPEPLES